MKLITKDFVQSLIPKREDKSYKGDFGTVLLVGGNARMGGAIILSASAAVHSGAGLVTVATHPTNQTALHSHLPEAMFLPMTDHDSLKELVATMDVVVVGPGLGRDEDSLAILEIIYSIIKEDQLLVVDGDAIYLHVTHDLPKAKATTVFTPHLGEWRTLTGLEPDEENQESNQNHAERLGATIVLKKDRTEVYSEGEVWQNTAGNPSMATGGMGDTLAGMIAGLLGQLPNKKHAILLAVFLHSYIGDRLAENQYVTLPSHIIEAIPKTMKELIKGNPVKWV